MSENKQSSTWFFPAVLVFIVASIVIAVATVWFSNASANNRSSRLLLGQNANQKMTAQLQNDFSDVQNVPSGLFRYGGSTTWATIRNEVDPFIKEAFPQFQLTYFDPIAKTPSSTSGIEMVLDGQLAFSQSSRPVTEAEHQIAKERGFTLKEIPVAIDAVTFAVNPELEISGLTVAQLQSIYRGEITNWAEVGGPNLPIIPYSRKIEESGTVEFFVSQVLDDTPFGSNVVVVESPTQALNLVSRNVGAIYFASAPEVIPQCTVKTLSVGRTPENLQAPYQEPQVPLDQCPERRNTLNIQAFRSGSYPVTRQLFVVIRQDGTLEQSAGETYANLLLTQTAQDLLARAGFVSIR